jgi:ribosomal protein L7/L12
MLENPAAFIKAVKPTEEKVLISITDYRQEDAFAVLKAFREVTGATLGHAKACVESAFPIYVITCADKRAASHIRLLQEAGATVAKKYVAT